MLRIIAGLRSGVLPAVTGGAAVGVIDGACSKSILPVKKKSKKNKLHHVFNWGV